MEPAVLTCADAPRGFGEKARAAIGVVIALGYFVLLEVLDHVGLAIYGPTLSLVCKWLIVPVLLLWAIKIEGLSPSSLGFRRPSWGTLVFALLAVLMIALAMGAFYRIIAPQFGAEGAPSLVHRLAHQSLRHNLIVSLTAGLVEELVFRFYAISRINWLTGNPWIGSLAPLLVFVGLHVPSFGIGQVVPATIGAIVLTGLYWLRRDYWCSALAHGLINLAGLTLATLAGR